LGKIITVCKEDFASDEVSRTDHIIDGVDLIFQCGGMKDSSLVGRKLLSYRHQLMATPEYLARFGKPKRPNDLPRHHIVAFARWNPGDQWVFENARRRRRRRYILNLILP
jgi:hypothetical protein